MKTLQIIATIVLGGYLLAMGLQFIAVSIAVVRDLSGIAPDTANAKGAFFPNLLVCTLCALGIWASGDLSVRLTRGPIKGPNQAPTPGSSLKLGKTNIEMHPSITPSEIGRKPALRMEECFFRIACWIPAIAFAFLIGFATVAAIRFDHWPQPSNPDPKDLNLPILHAAALLAYPLALLAIPSRLLVVILGWQSIRRRDVVIFTIGAALWAFILPITGRLFEWLID